ncbi:FtsQ-type POTRA domain-containing protein [Bartonella sp. TP]|uniref:cell division protein FtsQ/DivIB n=1 Tax=Bartonella sp. TP TaxID=3057550 RepID=UPI0025B1D071|nr:FtsQ-type POTRA domain-containing protein [Bartonella sp. TP]MDN5249132.1 FtsQ-type POTRA domain-containing protein [Alphaproteobacteria bacterium]WJW79767.1 FtsQ-type POTRA domain-containing protein [Bartonella sp. TP]
MQALNSQIIKNLVAMPALELPHYDFAASFRRANFNWRWLYKYLGIATACVTLCIGSIYSFTVKFDGDGLTTTLTEKFGFYVDHLNVQGNAHFTQQQLIEILGINHKAFLPSYDAKEARNRLLAFPWVKDAVVEKSYPNNLNVHIVERQPYAILQHAAGLALVDKSGIFIKALPAFSDFRNMPLLIAQDVDGEAICAVSQISQLSIASKIKAYRFVANRRWDLLLDNGTVVKLPASDVVPALERILNNSYLSYLLKKPGIIIDLRGGSSVIVASASKVQEQAVQNAI